MIQTCRVCLSCLLITVERKNKVSWERLEIEKMPNKTKRKKAEFDLYKAENSCRQDILLQDIAEWF